MDFKRIIFLSLVTIFVFVLFADYHTVQVGSFTDESAALTLQSQMEKIGLSPVTVQLDNGQYKVNVGEYDSYLEAKYINDCLKKDQIVTNGFIKKVVESKQSVSMKSTQSTAFEIFHLQAPSVTKQTARKSVDLGLTDSQIMERTDDELTVLQLHRKIKLSYLGDKTKKSSSSKKTGSSLDSLEKYIAKKNTKGNTLLQHAKVMNGIQKMENNDFAAARTSLEEATVSQKNTSWGMYGMYQLGLLEMKEKNSKRAIEIFDEMISLDSTNKTAGMAAMRIAYKKIAQNDKENAKKYFLKVAAGQVAASDKDRLEAMKRYTKLVHRQRDISTAYRAFKEMVDFAPTVKEKLQIKLEQAGLLLEGALCQKGTFAECAAFCQNTIDEYLSESQINMEDMEKIRLIQVESYYHNKDYQTAITMIDGHLNAGLNSDYVEGLMQYWKADSCFKLQRYQEATAAYEVLVNNDDKYQKCTAKGFDPVKISYIQAAKANIAIGEEEKAKTLLSELMEKYPESYHAKVARKLLGGLNVRRLM